MKETRTPAGLPHLDIEIAHRRLPEENAEQLSIRLRASPSFGHLAGYLESQPVLWSWLMVSPMLAWQQAMQAFLVPWLPLHRRLGSGRGGAGVAEGEASSDDKVHPFPGPADRGG